MKRVLSSLFTRVLPGSRTVSFGNGQAINPDSVLVGRALSATLIPSRLDEQGLAKNSPLAGDKPGNSVYTQTGDGIVDECARRDA